MRTVLALSVLVTVAAAFGCTEGDPESPSPTVAATSTTSPAALPVDDPAFSELWRWAAPESYYVRVAATDDVVIVVAAPNFPEFHDDERVVAALDPDSGSERWRITVPCAPLYPAVDDAHAYVPCNDGSLRAFRVDDGAEAWNVLNAGAPVVALVAEGYLFTTDGDPESFALPGVDQAMRPDGRVKSYDPATGTVRWEVKLNSFGTYLTLHGERLFAATENRVGSSPQGEVLAIDPDTGDVLWRTTTRSATSPPFVTGDILLVATHEGVQRLDAATGAVQWTAPVPGGGTFYSPVAADDAVVAGTNVNAIHSLDLSGQVTGEVSFCDCQYGATTYGSFVLIWGAGLGLLDPHTMQPVAFVDDLAGSAEPALVGNVLYAPFEPLLVAYSLD